MVEGIRRHIEMLEEKEKAYGRNCRMVLHFRRHANKEEFDPHTSTGEISDSLLSEKGVQNAYREGQNLNIRSNRIKLYTSPMDRGKQTGDAMLEAKLQENDAPVLYNQRVRKNLNAPHFSKKFKEEYQSYYITKPANFENLSLDEQEKIVEERENPAVAYWLDLDDEDLPDKETESARAVATKIAKEVTHFSKMIKRFKSKSDVDLLLITHRTATEPFLVNCLEPPLSTKDLMETGGSLSLLEGWDLAIETDQSGNISYTVNFRGKEYKLNLSKMAALAGENVVQ